MSLLDEITSFAHRILGPAMPESVTHREFGGFAFEIPDSFDDPLPDDELALWEGAAPE